MPIRITNPSAGPTRPRADRFRPVVMGSCAAACIALGAVGAAAADVQHYVIGADQLVGQNSGSLPRQSVGLYTDNAGQLRIAFGSGSSALSATVPHLQNGQAYAPANSFWGSTGVQQPDGTFNLAGMTIGGDITYNGQTWNSGLGIGGGGIAYLGNDTFVTGGLLADFENRGLTFTTSDGTFLGELSLGDTFYAGLQHAGTVGDIHVVYGANYSNILDGFLLNMDGKEIAQQITFPELEDKIITDLQLFDFEGEEYVAVAWSGDNGGGVQVYNWDVPPISQPCPGDVTGDGAVDLNDLSTVLANFGQHTPNGDANNDGVVDLNDLNIVLVNFGNQCR